MPGITEAAGTKISSGIAEGLNNKIKTAFTRFYGFSSMVYGDTVIYLVAGGLYLPALH
jgi:transposase